MTQTPSAIEQSVWIDAPASTVFRYFVDPQRMCAWMGIDATADPRPGGAYRVDVTGRDVAVGEYVELVPDERVVWTWGFEGSDVMPPGSTTVEVTLEADGDATVVRLRHLGLPSDERVPNHRAGWTHYLSRLAIAAGGGDAGPDPWATA
ncbi:MAG TPA: SRPBCC domain-containing protein [Acidimicrobiia bacterium]|nr:SRPBCC domain-containing protein [Acidimicrobiia bacterium]